MSSANTFDKIPCADFDIVCTKSESKVVKVHTYVLCIYSEIVEKMMNEGAGKRLEIDATFEEVVELMNIVYNMNFKDTKRRDLCEYEFSIIPARVYPLVKSLKIERLDDPVHYEVQARADVGDWNDLENIEKIAGKAADWIIASANLCTDDDLRLFFIKKMAKILAMYMITKQGNFQLWDPGAVDTKLFSVSPPVINEISKYFQDCVFELRNKGNVGKIHCSRWFLFVLYYCYVHEQGKDIISALIQTSSYCMIKAYGMIGCTISFRDVTNSKDVTLKVADLLDEKMTFPEMLRHDLKTLSLLSYVAGNIGVDGKEISVNFPASSDCKARVIERVTYNGEDSKLVDNFIIAAGKINDVVVISR